MSGVLVSGAVTAQPASAATPPSCVVLASSKEATRTGDHISYGSALVLNECTWSVKVKVDVAKGYDTDCKTIVSYHSAQFSFEPYPWSGAAWAQGLISC